MGIVVVVLGFYISPTAKVIRRQELAEKLEKPRFESTIDSLQGELLNNCATGASI